MTQHPRFIRSAPTAATASERPGRDGIPAAIVNIKADDVQ
jgi:hypothetical protein